MLARRKCFSVREVVWSEVELIPIVKIVADDYHL
jgi:hypothetical protein